MSTRQADIARIVGLVVLCLLWGGVCFYFNTSSLLDSLLRMIAGWQIGRWFYNFVAWVYPYNYDEVLENDD